MKKYIVFICIAIVSLLVGFWVEPSVRTVEIKGLIDFKMAQDGSVFMINCDKNKQYSLKKIKKDGGIEYDVDLNSKENKCDCVYRQLCVDDDNNVYLVRSLIEKDEDQEKISKEEIIRYAVDGVSLGAVAEVKPDDEDEVLKYPLINQLQIVNNDVKIVCTKSNTAYVLNVDRSGKNKPRVVRSFFLDEYQEVGSSWISDAVVTSDNKVIFVDKRGKMYFASSDDRVGLVSFANEQGIVPTSLSIDAKDNVFFTDLNNESFYKFDVLHSQTSKLYSEDKIINDKKNIKFKDLQFVFVMSDGVNFYGVKRSSKGASYVSFGNEQNVIEQIRYNKSVRAVEILIISLLTFIVLMIVVFLLNKIFKVHILNVKLFSQISVAIVASFVGVVLVLGCVMVKIQRESLNLYNQAGINVMSNFIDKKKLESTDFLLDYASADYKALNDDITKNFSKVETVSSNVNIYSVENGVIYRIYELTSGSALAKPDLKFVDLPKIPIKYVMDSDSYEKYYGVLNSFESSLSKEYLTLVTEDENGKWFSVVKIIKDSENKIIGLIESKFNYFAVPGNSNANLLSYTAILSAIFMVILIIYVYILLKVSFRPLKAIEKGILSVERGVYDNKLDVVKKNQFGDICNEINAMSESVYKKVSSLVLINEEYTKYTPKETFMLVNKNDITDISLSDKLEKQVCIMNIDLLGKKTLPELKMSAGEYFNIIHNCFNNIIMTIERNNGIIQQFNSFSITAVFVDSVQNAVRTALELRDSIKNERILSFMKISLCVENVVIGTVGNDDRKNIIVVSGMSTLLSKFISKFDDFPNKFILTQDVFESLDDEIKINYRCIGQIRGDYKKKIIRIYELFETKNEEQKIIFEKALRYYIDGDFENGRKLFTNVLCLNRSDKVSMYYLKKCDECLQEKIDDWSGYIM